MWIKSKISKLIGKQKEKWIIQNNEKLEITDLKNLCFAFDNIKNVDQCVTNAWYGHIQQLKQYAGIEDDKQINCVIEHGLNIKHNAMIEMESTHFVKTILTVSSFRVKVIESVSDFEAVSIGPYIAYAKDYCDRKKIEKEKKKYGKTLLVFPCQGTSKNVMGYNLEEFCSEIDDISKDYDTVMVCLGYRDVKHGLYKFYKKKGYVVVTAGYALNELFLSRLRLIFQLSDAVIANAPSTGIAYALYFNKPVYLYRQKMDYPRECTSNVLQLSKVDTYEKEFYKISSDKKFGNLKAQKEWGNYFFGLDQVKTREEMYNLLKPLVRE